ncbi:hypothetical protein DK37_12130 [Halomonas sp. SUBG004]|nr:hypothetical protein DK37_12130 [Halomonas sp. SUBG004]
MNHLDALSEGETALASAHLEKANQTLQMAKQYFEDFLAVPKSAQGQPYADAIEAAFTQLVANGLEPQYTGLDNRNEAAFRAAKNDRRSAQPSVHGRK